MRIVIALGGNAPLRRGDPMTMRVQRRNVRIAAEAIAPPSAGHSIVVAHGNGPQVGLLPLQAEASAGAELYPLDVLDADTQGMIGYLIQQELRSLLPPESQVATLLTTVLVDADDPAFAGPVKFVGPIYDEDPAHNLLAETGQFPPLMGRKVGGRHLHHRGAPAAPRGDWRLPPDAHPCRRGRWRGPGDVRVHHRYPRGRLDRDPASHPGPEHRPGLRAETRPPPQQSRARAGRAPSQ
jgi:hypothetical protein